MCRRNTVNNAENKQTTKATSVTYNANKHTASKHMIRSIKLNCAYTQCQQENKIWTDQEEFICEKCGRTSINAETYFTRIDKEEYELEKQKKL